LAIFIEAGFSGWTSPFAKTNCGASSPRRLDSPILKGDADRRGEQTRSKRRLVVPIALAAPGNLRTCGGFWTDSPMICMIPTVGSPVADGRLTDKPGQKLLEKPHSRYQKRRS
jgi:hypothetical protein